MDKEAEQAKKLSPEPVIIGKWIFDPVIFTLLQGQGSVKLEPRVAHLLYFLSQKPNIPISRVDLLAHVWPDMVVNDEALTSAIKKLRKALEDDSHNPEFIETIPKAGYRLIAQVVQINREDRSNHQDFIGKSHSSIHLQDRRRFSTTIRFLLFLLVTAGAYIYWQFGAEFMSENPASQNHRSDIPFVAVLPFANLSKDGGQEYFADGIAEDLITDLSRINNLRVLSQGSTFKFKGQAQDLKQIKKELNATHVVEGSVRRSGRNLRITARLMDLSSGQNIWAQRYDRELDDLFRVQDDVTQNIASSLSIKLKQRDRAEINQHSGKNFEAYDLYLKGRKALSLRTQESNLRAQDLYRDVISIDPLFARAYGGLAVALTRYANKGWSNTPSVERDLALHYAQKAVELDADSQNSFWALGFTHLYRKENKQAETAARKALDIAPGYSDGMALLALISNHSANAAEAIKLINEAMLLNPLYSWDYLFNLGWAEYTLGHYEKAIKFQKLALVRNEYATFARLILAASYIGLDMQDEADWEIEEILSYQANMSMTFIRDEIPLDTDKEKIKLYLKHLRQAGLPD